MSWKNETRFTIEIKKNNGILLPLLFLSTVKKKCSSDWEKLLKFEAEGWEFGKFMRLLEQFIYQNSDFLVKNAFF